MEAIIDISNQKRKWNNISEIKVSVPDVSQNVLLDIDFKNLYNRFGLPNQKSLDLVFIASIIYVIDRLIPRSSFSDNWSRQIEVEIPVKKLKKWRKSESQINQLLSFLTGDTWKVEFRKRQNLVMRLNKDQLKLDRKRTLANSIESVSLFSGGLDSLIGSIDLLENSTGNIQLLGHYDGSISGISKVQRELHYLLNNDFQGRSVLNQVRVGFVKNSATNKNYEFETSTRSRSILFLALGIYAAESVADYINLVIPENGLISLNMPFSPSRRGSCSTRTTHPFVIKLFNEILDIVGISQRVVNPYLLKTKGEMIRDCQNLDVLKKLYRSSVSCSKTGHTVNWIRRNANQCGVCVPCIIRRSALYVNGLDNEVYGSDFCSNSEVNLTDKKGFYQDLRDYVDFLKAGYNNDDLAKQIFNSGRYKLNEIDKYTSLVDRGLNEIDDILRNKASLL